MENVAKKKNHSLHGAASYLRDFESEQKEEMDNFDSYRRVFKEHREESVQKKPSFWKQLKNSFF